MPLPNQDATAVVTNNGLRTQYGLVLPPGAKVAAYVRNVTTTPGDGNDEFLVQNLCTTLAQGLARVRAGYGDFVVVLPGHVETVTDATTFSNALQAGTKIIGVGKGSNTPTFNFSTTTAQWAVNKNDVVIAGLRIALAANANNLAAAGILVTGSDFGFYYNDFIVSQGGSAPNTCIGLSAGADRADITGNTLRGIPGGQIGIDITAAIDQARICDNEMFCGLGTTIGHIRINAAATNLKILRNVMFNTTAASVACIVFGAFASTGFVADNRIMVLSTGTITSGTTGITTGATTLCSFSQNYVVNDPRVSGILSPAADT